MPESIAKPAATPNFGIDREKMQKSETLWVDGIKTDPEDAAEKGRHYGDETKQHLTFIGDTVDLDRCKGFLKDPQCSKLADTFWIQFYDKSNPMVAKAGFKTDGHPTVYIQERDGKTLSRTDECATPEILAMAMAQARRNPAPNNDPKKDPDLSKPRIPGLPDFGSIPLMYWLAGGVVLLFLLQPKS
jgi:hypothetical protein